MTKLDDTALYKEPSSSLEIFGFCNCRADPTNLSVKTAKDNESMEKLDPYITGKVR